MLLVAVSAHPQTTVSGKVVNAATGEPVPDANIRVDHSLAGGSTNSKGEFTLSNLPEGRDLVLSVTHVSYLPKRQSVKTGDSGIVIELQESHVNLDQVVVTGTGTHRRADNSTVPVQVITASDVRNSGAASLEEALVALSPNVTTVTNGMGTFLNINGVGQDYMLVLENGRRVVGDDRYARINTGNIKRIEILNGAASALYGSEAIGGVINIITDDLKNGTEVSSQTRLASKGRFTQSVDADVSIGKLRSYTVYKRQEADNWQVNDIDEDGYKTGRPMSAGFRSDNVSQRFALSVNDRMTLSLRGNFYDYTTRRPQSATYFKKSTSKDAEGNYIYKETQAYTYDMEHRSWMYGAGMDYMVSPSVYIEADFYADNYSSLYRYFTKSGGFVPGDGQKRKETHYYNGSVKGILKPDKINKVSVGLEYINERLESESDNIEAVGTQTGALFVQDEISVTRWMQGVVGLRYIYNGDFKHHVTPDVSLMFKPGRFIFRAAWSTGYRAPTLSQIYATDQSKTASRCTVGNTGLRPEKSNFWSLNAEYSNSWLSLRVTGLLNDISDMINYRVLSDAEIEALGYGELHNEFATVRQRDNVDKALVKSLSVSANAYLGAGFTIGGGYVLTDSEAKTYGTDGSGQEMVTVTPVDKSVRHSGNVNARWDWSRGKYHLNVALNGHIQGERYSSTYGYAPGYSQWDLNTSHSFCLDEFVIEPGIGVENIFNNRDERPWNSNFSTVSPGTSVLVSLVLRYKK